MNRHVRNIHIALAFSLMTASLLVLFSEAKTTIQESNALARDQPSVREGETLFVEKLVQADEFQLLSLDPCHEVKKPKRSAYRGPKHMLAQSHRQNADARAFSIGMQIEHESSFFGHPVFGATFVDVSSERRQLLKILEAGIQAAARADDVDVMCFIPRHGLRIEIHGHTVDFIICFECGYIFCSDPAFAGMTKLKIHADPTAFNRILDAAGIHRDDSAED